MVRRYIILIVFLSLSVMLKAQGYDQQRVLLSNFVERMYKSSPFTGCRIVEDYDNNYFIAVVEMDSKKYASSTVMNRVAEVKSQRIAGEFFNGTQSYAEFVIKTPKKAEQKTETDNSEEVDILRTTSIGFIRQLQLLTTFKSHEQQVYIYYKPIKPSDNNE